MNNTTAADSPTRRRAMRDVLLAIQDLDRMERAFIKAKARLDDRGRQHLACIRNSKSERQRAFDALQGGVVHG